VIWLYDNIDMRIEGRIIVRDIPNPHHAGFEHRATAAPGWIVNRKFSSVFASIFASLHPSVPAPFSVLDSRAEYEDADQPSPVFRRALTSS